MVQPLSSLVTGPQLPAAPATSPLMRGTAGLPGVGKPSAAPTFRFYIYPLLFSNLVAGTPQTGFIKMDAKYRFICYGLAASFYNPTANGIAVNPQNVEYRLSDTSSGAYYSNAPLKIQAIAGLTNKYRKYTVPLVFEKNSKLQIDINPIGITSANPPDLWLAFIGAQIAEYN
jgi:hypothetical protein